MAISPVCPAIRRVARGPARLPSPVRFRWIVVNVVAFCKKFRGRDRLLLSRPKVNFPYDRARSLAPEDAAVAEVFGAVSVRVDIKRTVSSAPQSCGGDLAKLGVEPLAHLHAAMGDLDAAIAIDQHQCACLVEKGWR
jgi:hypothetical protein